MFTLKASTMRDDLRSVNVDKIFDFCELEICIPAYLCNGTSAYIAALASDDVY